MRSIKVRAVSEDDGSPWFEIWVEGQVVAMVTYEELAFLYGEVEHQVGLGC